MEAESAPPSLETSHAVPSETIPLSALHYGEHGMVIRLIGGRMVLGRLMALGFTPGARIRLIQNYGRGPLIVRVRNAHIALGRREAGHILIHKEVV